MLALPRPLVSPRSPDYPPQGRQAGAQLSLRGCSRTPSDTTDNHSSKPALRSKCSSHITQESPSLRASLLHRGRPPGCLPAQIIGKELRESGIARADVSGVVVAPVAVRPRRSFGVHRRDVPPVDPAGVGFILHLHTVRRRSTATLQLQPYPDRCSATVRRRGAGHLTALSVHVKHFSSTCMHICIISK